MKNNSLTSILEQFESTLGTEKVAEDLENVPSQTSIAASAARIIGKQEKAMPKEHLSAAAYAAEAAKKINAVSAEPKAAPGQTIIVGDETKAAPELTDAKVLISIAKKAAKGQKASLEKEASEFGRLFAHGFMDEMEKTAMFQDVQQEAYDATVQALQGEMLSEKVAETSEESYDTTLDFLAQNSAREATLIKVAEEEDHLLSQVVQDAYEVTMDAIGG